MNDREILENTPKDATHVDELGDYYQYKEDNHSWFKWTCKHGGFTCTTASSISNLRSLADIKDLVTLRKRRSEALNYLYSEDEDASYNATCALEGE